MDKLFELLEQCNVQINKMNMENSEKLTPLLKLKAEQQYEILDVDMSTTNDQLRQIVAQLLKETSEQTEMYLESVKQQLKHASQFQLLATGEGRGLLDAWTRERQELADQGIIYTVDELAEYIYDIAALNK